MNSSNRLALIELLQNGYLVYPSLTDANELIIIGEDLVPHRVIIRSVSTNPQRGAILNNHGLRNSSSYDFILASWPLASKAWLIPAALCESKMTIVLNDRPEWLLCRQHPFELPHQDPEELKKQIVFERDLLEEATTEREYYKALLKG